jgi:hypothetical protein
MKRERLPEVLSVVMIQAVMALFIVRLAPAIACLIASKHRMVTALIG